MKDIPHPFLIYVNNAHMGTHIIDGLEYNWKYSKSYNIRQSFQVFSIDPSIRFGDFYHVVFEKPNNRFYFFYVNLNQDLATQLNILKHHQLQNFPPHNQINIPKDVHDDIKAGKARILLDYSIEGIPGNRYNLDYLFKFLGEYRNFVILVTGDYKGEISKFVPVLYRNTWERKTASIIRLDKTSEWIETIIDKKLIDKSIRPFKILMKNRIMKGHRLALSYIIDKNPEISKHINYSFSSRSTYNVDEPNSVWMDRCISESKSAAILLKTTNVEKLLRYAYHTEQKNLIGEVGLDLNTNQSMSYEKNIYEIHSNAYIQLVTESGFSENSLFNSEKSFQPIIMKQPFIMVAEYGMVALMREFGYDVFDDIIDHSYDLITDPADRMEKIISEIRRVCLIDTNTWAHGLAKLKPRLDQNFDHLREASTRFNDLNVIYEPRLFP
jgi:hypothetical protein